VDQVLALVRSREFQETPASRQLLEDLAVQARARAALRADDRTANIDVLIEVHAAHVTLKGIVVDEREKGLCEEIVARIAGVKGVTNELRTMAGGLYRFPSQPRDRR
jgi:osmotically-inducible protein OsmY